MYPYHYTLGSFQDILEAAEQGDHHSALDSANLRLNSQINGKKLQVPFRVLGKSSSAVKHKGDLNSHANAKLLGLNYLLNE